MSDPGLWDIDRVAAGELATALRAELDGERLGLVAELFARHRESALEWAAKRAQGQVLRTLEAAVIERAGRMSDSWAEGVAFAEQKVAAMPVSEILGIVPGRTRSFGQVLRSMLRTARGTAGLR